MRKNAAPLAAYLFFLSATALPAAASELAQEDGKFVQVADATTARQVKQDIPPKSLSGLAILQIGDSHTAADYFTGEVRRILQERFGDGGPGYLVVGTPHPGIRHSLIKSSLSAGWTYATLQKSNGSGPFSLTGFTAATSAPHETVSLTAETEAPYGLIEISTRTGPGRGAIEVALDNIVCAEKHLASDNDERIVWRIFPSQCHKREFKALTITTRDNGAVTLDAIGLFEKPAGLTYSNIGFPGATIDIINKFEPAILTQELKRLAPQIVVLAFGTNEGFKDDIDVEDYRAHFNDAVARIRAALPSVKLVMILPPDAARLTAHCEPEAAAKATCESNPEPPATGVADKEVCAWRRPPQLDRIRDVQREIAQHMQIPTWDWSKLMPADCGAHIWWSERHFMARDHIHFTQDGYRFSAEQFAKFLASFIDRSKLRQPFGVRK
jgi:lysophospholipase L1-like esterase